MISQDYKLKDMIINLSQYPYVIVSNCQQNVFLYKWNFLVLAMKKNPFL